MKREWAALQVGAGHMGQLIFGAKPFCLATHVGDQFRALNALRETGEVFDQRGEG